MRAPDTARFTRFRRDDAGATMAEYALLIAVVALVALAGLKTLGSATNERLRGASAGLDAGAGAPAPPGKNNGNNGNHNGSNNGKGGNG